MNCRPFWYSIFMHSSRTVVIIHCFKMSFLSFNNSRSVILQEYAKKCNSRFTVVVVAVVDLFILDPSLYFSDILKYIYSEWLTTKHLFDLQICIVVEVDILYTSGPETTGTIFSIFTACFSL